MTARQYLFAGRVQGVGFRYSTKNLAKGFDVLGWVKNLPDGRVELQIQEEQEERTVPLLDDVQGFSIQH